MDATPFNRVTALPLSLPPLDEMRAELRTAASFLATNRLHNSAKWAGELLLSLPTQSPAVAVPYHEELTSAYDHLQLARSLFDLKEYVKAASVLLEFARPEHPSAYFFYYYCLYIFSEYRREEESQEEKSLVDNKQLSMIEAGLKPINALCAYLLGVVKKARGDKDSARQLLIQSLNEFPLNWSAWLELAPICDEAGLAGVRNHWVKNFFIAQHYHKMQQPEEAIDLYAILAESSFPSSSFIYAQIGYEFFTMDDYTNAVAWFEQVEEVDPYRYELMDVYSNILYVREDHGKLSYLAYRMFYNDKYRPETCFVLGNYYSLKNEHYRAMTYFKRATMLDRKFVPAWILMGHEYIELQNVTKAIESYRTAIDLDPKDYRAWYGVAQAYEASDMNLYAIYYYTNALMSKTSDSRVWVALGTCYEKMGKHSEAAKCYEKAERLKDREGVVMHRLARLYAKLGMREKSANAFAESLARKDAEKNVGEETVEAIMFLKQYYLEQGKAEEAANFARRLYDFGVEELDHAAASMRDVEAE